MDVYNEQWRVLCPNDDDELPRRDTRRSNDYKRFGDKREHQFRLRILAINLVMTIATTTTIIMTIVTMKVTTTTTTCKMSLAPSIITS